MLINGILFNSEAWHSVTIAQIAKLEATDKALLRGIISAHNKTPKEFLHLETSTVPLKWIIMQRRINYMRHILGRNENELVKKVYLAQKVKPTSGDFVKLVETDLAELELTYEEAISAGFTKQIIKHLQGM